MSYPVIKAHAEGNRHSAYDLVTDLSRIAEGYKRARKVQYFILADAAIEAEHPHCAHCGEPITVERGNRGEYFPSRKQAIVMHYDCSWSVVLNKVFELGRYIYG